MKFSIFFFVALLLIPLPIFAEESLGSLNVKLEYTNGDRLDAFETSLIIYQDNKENLFEKLDPIQINPLSLSLPIGHKYFLEPVVNGIHLDSSVVDLDEATKSIKITIPLSGGVKFQVLYNDNYTPVEGATVSIKSSDGKEWKQSVTDENGHTARFWIQSTMNSQDYFIVDTSLGSEITYSYNPLTVQPGIPHDVKITTDFPKTVQRVDISIFKDLQNKLSKNDGKFIVELFDLDDSLVSKSNVNRFGNALVTLVKIGEYDLKIINVTKTTEELWYTEKIIVKNEVESFKIFPYLGKLSISDSVILSDGQVNPELNNCQCVAFRLDDIQDYWITNAQMKIIDIFQERKIPLTIGLIGGLIGEDEKIVSFIKERLVNGTSQIELANHSMNDDRISQMSKQEQTSVINQTNIIIEDIFKVRPTTFIPPGNLFNEQTLQVLRENNFTHISASILTDPGPFPLTDSEFYHFPQTAATGIFNPDKHTHFHGITNEITLSEIMQSIEKNGYAVVMMHPQEFSLWNGEELINEVNLEQFNHLETLLDKLHQTGIVFTTIGKINLDSINEDDFIDNNFAQPASADISASSSSTPAEDNVTVEAMTSPSCNCISFRLDGVQDWFLSDINKEIISKFHESGIGLTMGVIGNNIGSNPTMVEFLKNKIIENKQIEIANNGWNYEDFTDFNQQEQEEFIALTDAEIMKNLGVEPKVFIPPYNKFNEKTLISLDNNGYTHISSSSALSQPPYLFSEQVVYHFPKTVSLGILDPTAQNMIELTSDKTFDDIENSIEKFGFAVVSMQSQEFSMIQDGIHTDKLNLEQMISLDKLIKKVKQSEYKIVTISQINLVS